MIFKNMKISNMVRGAIVILFASALIVGCASSDELASDNLNGWDSVDDYDEIEQAVLDSWIELNYPDLVDNRQEDGYYIEILSEDKDLSYPMTNTTSCWVEYNITSKDLQGNICHTRSESTAIQQGTFTKYTRYVPMKKYVSLLDEDIYESYYDKEVDDYQDSALILAMRAKEAVIDGVSVPLNMTVGSKFRIWMPSLLIEDEGNGSYGYAGQFSLSSGRPMISEIEITNVVVNAEQNEKEVVDWFVESQESPLDWKFVDDKYADYIYINYNYTPYTPLNYLNQYNYTQLEYTADFAELEQSIVENMVDVFGEGVEYTGDDAIGDALCYFWYITRTMDGFIVDTNIEEVKELIYSTSNGTSEDDGTALTFDYDVSYSSYVKAIYYSIPRLEYGQWATVITTSLEAYHVDGVSAGSTATEIPAYTPLIFQIYVEPADYDI